MADPKYTVYVRVPIPRGEFVDPPQVHWDSARDEDLWKILSGASQKEVDWHQVALRFQVPVDFLLQQVAFLTERHASQVRAQVRKATAAARGSAAPSPIPGSDHPRTTSALSVQRDPPIPRHDGGVTSPLTGSGRQSGSHNTSTHTVGHRDASGASGRPPVPVPPADRRRLSSLPIPPTPPATVEQRRAVTPGPAGPATATSSDDDDGDDDDDDDDDDEGSSPVQSRIIRRPPRFQQAEAAQPYGGSGGDGDSEEGSEPAFQPYHPASDGQDLASTLKGDNRVVAEGSHQSSRKDATLQSQMSDSSAGSGANLPRANRPRNQKTSGPMSPRRAVELASRGKGKAVSHEGSDGTPSMGSSFSDLDDASVTQSALEEALASHMNRGAISSRFSISQAFRSRYGPGPGQ
ncbi:hypothetical protein XA68_11859 [Ophiocordyceps unilateralis]|uniref:Autophagy-related protein 29 n=1 Tax=Ophiocordyceps unilateralis TaxID=268505 RepID=A0A2A9PFL4_OPHUN|nr:hypothetical protein XA68_11859 [Ophiocordyceps unilateralis]